MILLGLSQRDMSRTQRDAGHRAFDPELDSPGRLNPPAAGELFQIERRLIANPFLAFLSWFLAGSLLRAGLKAHDSTLSLAAFAGMLVSLLIVQYHCLDCGKTGWAFRARRHQCSIGEAYGSSAVRRSIIPGLMTQLKIWFVLLIAATCYYLLHAAATAHR